MNKNQGPWMLDAATADAVAMLDRQLGLARQDVVNQETNMRKVARRGTPGCGSAIADLRLEDKGSGDWLMFDVTAAEQFGGAWQPPLDLVNPDGPVDPENPPAGPTPKEAEKGDE